MSQNLLGQTGIQKQSYHAQFVNIIGGITNSISSFTRLNVASNDKKQRCIPTVDYFEPSIFKETALKL